MGERRYERRAPSLFWPVILVAVGLLLLLDNLGYIDVNLWDLWRLWPVLLILIGLDLVFGRRSALGRVIVLLLTLVVVGAVVLLIIGAPGTLIGGGARSSMDVSAPLGDTERARFQISFAAGELRVGALEDAAALVEGALDLATQRQPSFQDQRDGGEAELELAYRGAPFNLPGGRGDTWDVRLSPQAAFDLHVSLGAGDAQIDLTGLDIRKLEISGGVGTSTIVLPATGSLEAEISGGLGTLVIEVPKGMAARIAASRGIGGLDVASRFRRQGDTFISSDWESATNRIDLRVSVGIGNITVKER